jgi:hypothetical protein
LQAAENWRDFNSHDLRNLVVMPVKVNEGIIPEWFNKMDKFYMVSLRKEWRYRVHSEWINTHPESGNEIKKLYDRNGKLDTLYTNSDWYMLFTKANSREEAREKSIGLFEKLLDPNEPEPPLY